MWHVPRRKKWRVQFFCVYQGKPMDGGGENNNEGFEREATRRIKRAERKSFILWFGFEIMT